MAKASQVGSLYTLSTLESKAYDVVCIGSGWAARPVAARTVKAGMSALVIDEGLIGGDCPFWACVPSKALLRPAEALEATKAVGGAREQVSSNSVDVQAVFERRDFFTGNWDDGKLLVPSILSTGTDLLRGTGQLVREKVVKVTSQEGQSAEIVARHAVAICTGSVPVIPETPGLKEAQPWTPRVATSSHVIPTHLAVLGAGAVGIEMATAYSSFGARVTVITKGREILSKLDPEAGEQIRAAMSARGVEFLLNTELKKVERQGDTSVLLTTSTGDTLKASEVLLAAGRRACTDGCGLENFGLPVDGTPIRVDESLRVSTVPGDWLFAVGDVNGRSPLTHMCKYQGRIAAAAIVRQAQGTATAAQSPWDAISATADHEATPSVVFSRPAVASVGLTRKDAEQRNLAVQVVQSPVTSVGMLLHGDGLGDGWAQWVIEKDGGRLLGMTLVGGDVNEMIHAATVAIVGGLRLSQLAHAVPCFPTMSEVYLNLLEAAGY